MQIYRIKNLKVLFEVLLFICIGYSCGKAPAINEDTLTESISANIETKVSTQIANKKNFCKEMICNGQLSAYKSMSVIVTNLETHITKILVKNGQYVKNGEVLAILDSTPFDENLKIQKADYEKSKIEYNDILLGHGIRLNDTSMSDEGIKNLARIKSGMTKIETQLQAALQKSTNCKIKSSISGCIANLFVKENYYISNNFELCRIIDNTYFEVQFKVFDSELPFLEIGQNVSLTAFALPCVIYDGYITEINPVVDENGMLYIKAIIENKNKMLLEGMKVQIIVKQFLKDKIIVPKKAVVVRDGKSIIFSKKNETAFLNYVTIGYENNNSYTIESGINENDEIIIDGNDMLTHRSLIKVIKKEN